MTGKILVLTAIDDELDKARAPEGVEVIYSGVGKVNASSAATLALLVLRPSLVINYGTAGKINREAARPGRSRACRAARHDGDAAGATRPHAISRPALDKLSSGFGDVTCGTGDSFVTTADPWLNENNIDLVDMELFAHRPCLPAPFEFRGAPSNSSPTTPTISPPSIGPPMSPMGRICSGMR